MHENNNSEKENVFVHIVNACCKHSFKSTNPLGVRCLKGLGGNLVKEGKSTTTIMRDILTRLVNILKGTIIRKVDKRSQEWQHANDNRTQTREKADTNPKK
ncbi:hypothetical protein DPMN_056402 [Dreissena polymorpha]|uniref:Uncharacterized protein n=1 Tax=Dreissena polymorpha TaxID=45954 RepID=A0A9D4CUB8_DREPO|nr:hypothetical protein DPMN_056402 [Dreissena polymorpha]